MEKEREGGRERDDWKSRGEDLLVRMPGKSLVDLADDTLGKWGWRVRMSHPSELDSHWLSRSLKGHTVSAAAFSDPQKILWLQSLLSPRHETHGSPPP